MTTLNLGLIGNSNDQRLGQSAGRDCLGLPAAI